MPDLLRLVQREFLVSFYLVATDDSSSARTSPIHKEKFNVPLSGDEHKDLFNFARKRLAEMAVIAVESAAKYSFVPKRDAC